MKTFILHLDQHDDIISARDKMGWGKSGRILVVWPERGQVLNRRLDLLLLQRHCAKQGAKLAIVSRDPEVRYHAPRLGIPVFKSLRRAQRAAWRVPRRFRKYSEEESSETLGDPVPLGQIPSKHSSLPERPPRAWERLNPLIRLLAFTSGVLAFLAIAALLLPSAEISLQPEELTQTVDIGLIADPDYKTVDISGKVPAYWTKVTVEGRDSLPTSGTLSLPDQTATGEALFTNLTEQSVDIPAGTIIHTLDNPPVRFELTKAGSVPGGLGQRVTLPIRCLEPGTIGNLGADKLVALEGSLGTQVNVSNPQPTRGGRQRQEAAPNQEDRDLLYTNLETALLQTAAQEIQLNLDQGDLWWPASLSLSEVLEQEYQPAGQEPADILELNLQLEFEALWIPAAHIQELAGMVLDSNLPPEFAPLEEEISIQANAPNKSSQTAGWELHASRRIQASLSGPQIIQISMGQTPDNATSRLVATLALAAPPEISLSPEWWPRLPILPFRITIVEME